MKCKSCGKSFEKVQNIKLFSSLILLFLVFSGFILFATIELMFVSGVVALLSITQIEKKYMINNKVFLCNNCKN